MYAPNELHLLAKSAGLEDDIIIELWHQARNDARELLGDSSHPAFDQQTHRLMIRLIEDKAAEGIPYNLVPWVMLDLHVAALIVDARHGVKALGSYIKNHLPGNRAA